MEGAAFVENITPDFSVSCKITTVFHTRQSKFQNINVVDTLKWGRCIYLDGRMQSSEKDEYVYHENLVHPIMLAHPNPKRIFIGGGGEGATAREILKHKTVEKVVMVDIDEQSVEVAKKYLPKHSNGSFNDPRLHLVIADAKAHLENNDEKFDVIIMDLADPLEGGPCKLLYTNTFYQTLSQRLNEGGLVITQAGPAGVHSCTQVFTAIQKTLKEVFPSVFSYVVHIPSFSDAWGFHIASLKKDIDISKFTSVEIEKKISERIRGGTNELFYFDGDYYSKLFILPKCIRLSIQNETRTITEENPLVLN